MKILTFEGCVKNAKSYPYWEELCDLLKDHEVTRVNSIIPIAKIKEMVNNNDIWISIDSFLPHLVHFYHLKPGIVIWGKSDPLIFGYPENRNLFKDTKYLKAQQFQWWKDEPIEEKVFITPQEILTVILSNG